MPLLKELILCFVSVYPGFHFGLCPHYTLGFEEVSCLRHSILPSPNQSHTITHIKNRIIHPFKIQRHTYWNLTMHTFKFNNIHYSKLNGTHIQIEQYTRSNFNDTHHSYLTTYTIPNSTAHTFKSNNTHILAMSPERAILIHSPGRKPWVNHRNTSIEPQRGGTTYGYSQSWVA